MIFDNRKLTQSAFKNYGGHHMFRNILVYMVLAVAVVTITGCGSDDKQITNSINLPTDSLLSLYCENVGIYPETCVLKDPDNPYKMVSITEDNKFTLSTSAPNAKSRFYVWATAMAKAPSGENQFYVASSLHTLYTEGRGDNSKTQAVKAYRSVLDNFKNSLTYWKADWLTGTPTYALQLKDLTGMRLYDPRGDNLLTLFPNTISNATTSAEQSQYDGLHQLAVWGFSYNPTPNAITKLGTLN
jgi:hypothetical protein